MPRESQFMTDEQWLALARTGVSRVGRVSWPPPGGGSLIVRRSSGDGFVVDPDGTTREYDENGKPVDVPLDAT